MTSVDRIQGLSGQQAIKTPCRLATTAAITLSGEQTVDGVAAVEGDRVLVKDQANTTANGVYDVSTGNWTRSLDFDGANDIADGTMVLVGSGSTNADLVFKLNATEPIEIGTTALTFTVATTFTDISAFAATLLDDANAAAARATLGLAIGTDVQAYNATLAALAAQTEAANKVQYYTADNIPGLLDFKDEDNMASDSATAVPSQQSVKAYADTKTTAAASAAAGWAPKAWVRFNGTGTLAVVSSYNVASVTDNGTGDYTINFTTPFVNTNYAVIGFCDVAVGANNGQRTLQIQTIAVGSCQIRTVDSAASPEDQEFVSVVFYGDQ